MVTLLATYTDFSVLMLCLTLHDLEQTTSRSLNAIVLNEVYGQNATDKNNPGQNAAGQNAARKIDSRTKCHPRNERPDKMPLARAAPTYSDI